MDNNTSTFLDATATGAEQQPTHPTTPIQDRHVQVLSAQGKSDLDTECERLAAHIRLDHQRVSLLGANQARDARFWEAAERLYRGFSRHREVYSQSKILGMVYDDGTDLVGKGPDKGKKAAGFGSADFFRSELGVGLYVQAEAFKALALVAGWEAARLRARRDEVDAFSASGSRSGLGSEGMVTSRAPVSTSAARLFLPGWRSSHLLAARNAPPLDPRSFRRSVFTSLSPFFILPKSILATSLESYEPAVTDPVLGYDLPSSMVHAHPLFPWEAIDSMDSVFGDRHVVDAATCLNGIAVCDAVWKLLERGILAIVPDADSSSSSMKTKENQLAWKTDWRKGYKITILDPGNPLLEPGRVHLPQEHGTDAPYPLRKGWASIEGRRVLFDNRERPSREYLFWFFLMGAVQCVWRVGACGDARSVVGRVRDGVRAWAVGGKYVRRGVLCGILGVLPAEVREVVELDVLANAVDEVDGGKEVDLSGAVVITRRIVDMNEAAVAEAAGDCEGVPERDGGSDEEWVWYTLIHGEPMDDHADLWVRAEAASQGLVDVGDQGDERNEDLLQADFLQNAAGDSCKPSFMDEPQKNLLDEDFGDVMMAGGPHLEPINGNLMEDNAETSSDDTLVDECASPTTEEASIEQTPPDKNSTTIVPDRESLPELSERDPGKGLGVSGSIPMLAPLDDSSVWRDSISDEPLGDSTFL